MDFFLWLLWSAWLCSLTQSKYLSRPDIDVLPLNILVNELPIDDNDLIFLTSHVVPQAGPTIYDLRGELVWVGREWESGIHVHGQNLHQVQYHGSPHLVYAAVPAGFDQVFEFERSNRILNSSYDIVAEITSPDPSLQLDPHEFEVLDDGKTCIYLAKRLHPTGGPDGEELFEAVFQEYDLVEEKVVFEWRSLPQVPATETCSSGTRQLHDYFHINSVQKDDLGNYLINGFNVCNTYYISGRNGAILWTLGANSSFTFVDAANNPIDFQLKDMHHVRIIPLSQLPLSKSLARKVSPSTHIALTVYDNAYGASDTPPTSSTSSALLLLLSLRDRTAEIIERHFHPRGKLAAMFGSVTLLPNGDRLIGWGCGQDLTQQTRDGRIKWHALYGTEEAMIGTYRIYKGPWVGAPNSKPAVYAYAWGCKWPSVVHVSWNGATEVSEYRVYGAPEEGGGFVPVARGKKTGFETALMGDRFAAWMLVEALDRHVYILGRSDAIRTHVPPPYHSRLCDQWRCAPTSGYGNYYHECSVDNSTDFNPAMDGIRQIPL